MNTFDADFIQQCLDDIKILKEKKRTLRRDILFYEQELISVKQKLMQYADRILGVEYELNKALSASKLKSKC